MELGMAHMYTHDMGDTPAQLVLDKMAQAKARRREEEMKEELNKIKIRVENTIGSFEMQQKWLADQGFTNMEFFDDLAQLEAIISDSVQKKKYQHQVTVFIVGYEQASMERLQLLVQLNEFFVVNSATKEEDTFPMSPDIDLDDVADSVRSALDTAEKAVLRLGQLNHDLVAFVGTHISAKDSKTKSKKKLEKALNQAKDDVLQLTEKLMNAQAEIKEKEEKITSMFKQMELKTIELQRYKSAADLGKKHAEKVAEVETELAVKDGELKQLRSKVDELQVMLEQAEAAKENAQTKNRDFTKENEDLINDLQSKLNLESYKMEDAIEELKAQYKEQITDLKSKHKDEITQLNDSHMEELKNFLGKDADQYLGSTDGDIREWASSSEDERSFPTKARNKNLKQKKAAAQRRDELKKSTDSIDEWSEEGGGMVEPAVVHASLTRVQGQEAPSSGDESVSTTSRSEPVSGGRPQLGSRSMSNLTPVEEGQFEGRATVLEEENWEEVSDEELRHKFADYRQNARQHVQDLEYQLKIVVNKSNKRVNLMKGQMQDQRNKFEGERQVLLEQVSQAQRLQEEAEKEADEAMMQLEEFINEQERIEMAQADVRAQREAQEQQVTDTGAVTVTAAVSQVDLQLADVNTRRSSTASAKLESVFPPTEGLETEDRDATARASMSSRTSQIRAQLEEKRAAMATRRSNAKVSAGSSFHSDVDVPLGDYEGGDWADREISTQNTASSVRATADHPAVKEYLKTYSSVVDFKNNLAKLMIDKEMMSASQLLNDITPVQFDSSQSVQQQLREMKVNIRIVLQEVGTIFQNCVSSDLAESKLPQICVKEAATSTEDSDSGLDHEFISRTPPPPLVEEPPLQHDAAPPVVSSFPLDYRVSSLMASREGPGSRPAPSPVRAPLGVSPSEEEARRQLEEELEKLRIELDTRTKEHEDQLRRNTVAMMEMQDVIQQLQRDVGQGSGVKVDLAPSPLVVGPQPSPEKYPAPGTPTEQSHPQPVVESAIMFSRLDSERNAKSLKRAVNSGRLSPDVYEEVVGMMDQYVEIPGKRLRHLAEKYLHHSEMKAVEENVRRSSSLNGEVFKLLEKMETLQNKRAQKWSAQMDRMGDHRVRLANLLMDTLETIEQESGIFLIKPMFAYRGRARLRKYDGKISQNYRTPNYGRYTHFCDAPPIRLMKTPAPTPAAVRHPSDAAAAMYAAVHVGPTSGVVHTAHSRDKPSIPQLRKEEEDPVPVDLPVHGAEYVVLQDPTETTWSPRNSQAHALAETNGATPSGTHLMNTPRILELDVNRMLIGRNTISLRIPKPSLGDDRLKNIAQTNVRSYMTLSRPSGTGASSKKPKRPHSTTGADLRGFEPPPSTPLLRHPASAGPRVAPFQVSDMPSPRPLPPIRLPTSEKKSRPSTSQTGHLTAESASPAPGPTSPPRSPPGSSIGPSPALPPSATPPPEEQPPPPEEQPPPAEENPPEAAEVQESSEVQYEDRATSVMTEASQQSGSVVDT